jgi:hypothetical protein
VDMSPVAVVVGVSSHCRVVFSKSLMVCWGGWVSCYWGGWVSCRGSSGGSIGVGCSFGVSVREFVAVVRCVAVTG